MLEELEKKLQKKKKLEKKVKIGVRERRKRNILIGILLGMIATAVLLILNKRLAISFISFFLISGLQNIFIGYTQNTKHGNDAFKKY